MSKRNKTRLEQIRKLPCVRCAKPAPSQACHSNFHEHEKGMGTKANDIYTIPLCHKCHVWFDQYKGMTKAESKVWFDLMLRITNEWLKRDEALNGVDF